MQKHKGLLRVDLRSNAGGFSGVLQMMPKGKAHPAETQPLDSALLLTGPEVAALAGNRPLQVPPCLASPLSSPLCQSRLVHTQQLHKVVQNIAAITCAGLAESGSEDDRSSWLPLQTLLSPPEAGD